MTMDPLDFKDALYETLITIQPRNITRTHVTIRCPFCGDSVKHQNSTHFGIKIDRANPTEPVLFNCFLCNTAGVMTAEILHSIEVNDIQITAGMKMFNKSISGNLKRMGYRSNTIEMSLQVPEDNDLNRIKLEYVQKRLGISFTYEELVGLKTVFSLAQLLSANEIDSLTTSVDKARELNLKYVGWLTTKKEKIVFRQVLDSSYKRYEKYEIFNQLDNTTKFYTIPNQIDLLSNEPTTLVIAEGTFDIIGAYYHVFNCQDDRTIYSAACGSGFLNVIKYFIRQGFINNLDVIILSDNEPHRTKKFYKKELEPVSAWINHVQIYYNELSKDFGVPKNQIKVKTVEI